MAGVDGHATVARGLNLMADAVSYTMKKAGKVVAPTLLGAVGGYLTGVGARLGGFQGATAGAFYSCVLIPAGSYIRAHGGNDEDQIHDNTQGLLYTVGVVSETVAPIFITMYYGEGVLNAVGNRLPESVSWLVYPAATGVAYTATRGFFTNIAPAMAQYFIEGLRASDSRR